MALKEATEAKANALQHKWKTDFKSRWRKSKVIHGLSYTKWLEEELLNSSEIMARVQASIFEKQRRFEAFAAYIADLDKGLTTVSRSSATLAKIKDNEVVVAAMESLRRILEDAKQRFHEGVSKDNHGLW
jgi:hypothetical protein